MPTVIAEDFAFYLIEKPGCFFMLGTKDYKYPKRILHCSDYDFNDSMIGSGGYFWIRVIEDRLNVSILWLH